MKRSRRYLTLLFVLPVFALAAQAGERVTLAELRANTHIHGIAVHPKDSKQLYLATHHGVFLVSPDGWATRVSSNSNDYMGFTPHPSEPAILYASGHPVGGGNLGFIMSSDGGRTWQRLSKGINGPVDFHQMDVSKVDPNVIYGVFGGLQRSRDGGRTWEMAGDVPERLIDLAASAKHADRLYAATKGGLFITLDAGKSWLRAYALPQAATMVHGAGNGEVYAFIVGVGLIRGTEPDLRWQTLSKDFGDQYILHLAFDSKDPANVHAVTHKGAVLTSADGGRNWRPFGER